MVTLTNEAIDVAINRLIAEYDFPAYVLDDVTKRLSDCKEPAYAAQQLRYLENVVAAGKAPKK